MYLFGDDVRDAVEGEDGAGPNGSVFGSSRLAADVRQQLGDDFLDSEGTEGGQSDDAISSGLARLELFDEDRQEFTGNDRVLVVAEFAHHGHGEALVAVEFTTGLVQQIGDSPKGGLLQLLGRLQGARLDKVLQ